VADIGRKARRAAHEDQGRQAEKITSRALGYRSSRRVAKLLYRALPEDPALPPASSRLGSVVTVTSSCYSKVVQCRKQSGYLAVLAALAACGANDSQRANPGGPPHLSSVELLKRLAEIAGQSNQAAPADVDANTRLDGAKAGPGLRLTITYTLVNSESEGVNSATFETRLAAVIKDGSCRNPELRPLIDQGVLVVLEYRGNDGGPIGKLNIDRATCSTIH
jgi:hypothetical protein